jgi:hypothetical protein
MMVRVVAWRRTVAGLVAVVVSSRLCVARLTYHGHVLSEREVTEYK